MAFQAELCPADWREMRQMALKESGYQCQQCGVHDRAIQTNTRTGNPYMVYLSLAHKRQYRTWDREADIMVLCQRCHRRYDQRYSRKPGRLYHSPIGYVSISVFPQGKEVLAGMVSSLGDLFDQLDALPPGRFELRVVVVLAVVGNGHYHKHETGAVQTIAEYGACVGFSQLMQAKKE